MTCVNNHLVALVSFPTLTAAAESVGLTKSALSKSIQRIEDLYGVKIIERSRQGIQITAYREVWIDAAERGIEMFLRHAVNSTCCGTSNRAS